MAEVLLKDITKIYDGKVKAVDKANISIKDQEFMVLVGPSGCGKSTTLRMIAGLEDISDGELYIDGKMVNDEAPKDRDIAMVFQNYALYPHMTVYDNMAFGLRIRKYPKAEIDARVKEAAKILEIEELLDRRPKQLSGGQRQRVAVGRAIVRKPKVFLFDEPLSNLDAKLRVQMRAEISSLHSRLKATMVYVTHDQIEAMTMGDRIVVMKGGLIQQIGTPLGLYNHPCNRFVAGFIGSPPMNISSVSIRDEDGKIVASSEGLRFIVEDQARAKVLREKYLDRDLLIGIRPEDLDYTETASADNNIKAQVTVIEPLGAETQLFFETATHQFIAKCKPQLQFSVDQEVNFSLVANKVHFFDLETENSVFLDEDVKAKS